MHLNEQVKIRGDAAGEEADTASEEADTAREEADTTEEESDTAGEEAENDDSVEFTVFGTTDRQPLLSRAASEHEPPSSQPSMTAAEQLRLAKERVEKEQAQCEANAARAAAELDAAAKRDAEIAEAAKREAAKIAEAAKREAAKISTDALWQARVVFEKDMPPPWGLEPFDFKTKAPIGQLVLIPAKKYPAFAVIDAKGKEGFMGWAGKLMAYEQRQTKMKVKVMGDKGIEHMSVSGTGPYALANLIRLT